jgi:3-hydroxyisobutyrate dehydrogenase-like beta-hydroxyacid dehydrogenase
MGAAMVGTLRREGFDVAVWNRTAGKAEQVASATEARVAGTARAAVADADVVVSSVADDAAVTEVYTGESGAAPGLKEGAVVLEMSTIDPRTLDVIRPAIESAGAALVDAPVSGSVPLVEQGNLTIMAGGDAGAIETAAPVLEALSAKVFHVGDLGAGATIKLAVNAIVHATNVALAEALVLAERAGVERSTAYEVFAGSAAASPFMNYKRAAFENPDGAPVAFSLDLVAKDLGLILGLASGVGAEMLQAVAGETVVREAIAAGLGGADMSAVATYLRSTG